VSVSVSELGSTLIASMLGRFIDVSDYNFLCLNLERHLNKYVIMKSGVFGDVIDLRSLNLT
jgi:hypothetical protein